MLSKLPEVIIGSWSLLTSAGKAEVQAGLLSQVLYVKQITLMTPGFWDNWLQVQRHCVAFFAMSWKS